MNRSQAFPSWDGNHATWSDYVRRVRLEWMRTAEKKKRLVGASLASKLTGKAWEVTIELDPARLQDRCGASYLLDYLEEKLAKTLVRAAYFLDYRCPAAVSIAPERFFSFELRASTRISGKAAIFCDRGQPSRSSEVEELQRWTDEEWDDWGGRWRRDDRSETSDRAPKELLPEPEWEKYDIKDIEVLPTEILGWLLLRKRGLPSHARLAVLSATNNVLELNVVEKALRDQEEELLASERHRDHRDNRNGCRRAPTELRSTGLGTRPSTTLRMPMECGGPTKPWMGIEECYQADPDGAKEVAEAYAAYEQKVRNFKESRQLIAAKNTARGYSPLSEGKQKGKSKFSSKGGKSTGKCWLPKEKESRGLAMLPTPGHGKGSASAASYMVMNDEDEELVKDEASDRLLCYDISSDIPQDFETAWAAAGQLYAGFGIVDSGATETVGSLEAVEAVMSKRKAIFGMETVSVFPNVDKSFRFGERKRASSYLQLPQLLNKSKVQLGLYTLDVPQVPILIGVKTLKRLGALIDFEKPTICFKKIAPDVFIPLCTPLALVSAASCRHWAIHSEGKLFMSLRSGGWQTVCHRWRRPLATARREPSDDRVAPSGLDELLWCPVPAEGSNGKSTSHVWQQPPTRALSGTLQTWPSTVASDCVGKNRLIWQRYRGWHASKSGHLMIDLTKDWMSGATVFSTRVTGRGTRALQQIASRYKDCLLSRDQECDEAESSECAHEHVGLQHGHADSLATRLADWSEWPSWTEDSYASQEQWQYGYNR
ncbi:unnamed protein product [Symbiodinium sp. CCMP2592]|nr:unnamed protein product [Symbiodinium sp. CCMP2592]